MRIDTVFFCIYFLLNEKKTVSFICSMHGMHFLQLRIAAGTVLGEKYSACRKHQFPVQKLGKC